ncbi:MAG TPA: D-alanyl-D-alanine carboxypeptidase/D-alanyl-D-alanine-endopeptidase [Vicinamibacterales bacterium]
MHTPKMLPGLFVAMLTALTVATAWPHAQTAAAGRSTLAERIDAIMARPPFKHALFGIEFYSLDTNRPIYSVNADKLFVPGSTTKLITMGSALQILGADYRFHTRVYRVGDVDGDGTLHGDVVLVASGDTNLSGRIRPGDTLTFENVDHSYGGPDSHGLDGDPLRVIRELAASISSHGIKRIDGRVIVDASLFPEGERDGGTRFVISPIVVNDNAIDLVVQPGASEGAAVTLKISPVTAYAHFVNHLVTGKAGSRSTLTMDSDVARGDGTHVVTLDGSVPADAKPSVVGYRVPQPSRFAEIVLAEALHERGVVAAAREVEDKPDIAALSKAYTPDHAVAEHVSPALAEEVKITLKVSQNLHASATPFLLGALESRENPASAAEKGFVRIRQFLETTGADVSGASQSDGAGAAAHFTPDFMVHYLAFMAKQPSGRIFHDALPILGKDGTLWNIQVKSPAAGSVHAKTGTYSVEDLLHEAGMVTGKGLAGYMTTKDGEHLALAIYVNNVAVKDAAEVTSVVGEALGEIAAAAFDAKPDRRGKK